MALSASHLPGASTHPHPTPAAIPAPAATPALLSPSKASYSPLSSEARPFVPSGRSKTQRWEGSPPVSGVKVSPPPRPSFRDVVLSMAAPVSPRIVLRSEIGLCTVRRAEPDQDGWVEVVDKRTRRRPAVGAQRSRREVPADLRGRLPPSHALFPLLGDRAPLILVPARCDVLRQVRWSGDRWWWPLTRLARQRPPMVNLHVAVLDAAAGGGRLAVMVMVLSHRPLRRILAAMNLTPTPICVIDRSTRMDNTEVDLQRALVVTIGGNRPSLVADRVLREVARSYNLAEGTIQVTPFAPEDFLLLLPDREVAERVYNGGRPFHDPGFTLLFKRWSRLAQADTAALPTFVEGELLGVPAHAWELATAQKLLGGSSWARAHPPVVDLIIPEPTDALVEVPPRKRGLVYPIHLAVAVGGSSQETPPSPPPSDAGQERRRRRRRRRSPGPTSSSAGVQPRQSVQSRLGPPPASFNHVALADAFAAREASPQVVIAASSAAVRETSPPAAASPLPSASISLQNGGAVMMEKVPQAAGGSRLAAPGPFAVPETAAGAPSVMAAVSSPGSLGAAPSLVELGPMVDATASFGGPEPDGLMPSLVGPGLVEVAAAQPAVQSNFSPSPRLCAETPSLSDACTPRPAGLPPLMLVEPQAPEIADCGSAPALQVYSRRRGRGGGDTAPPLAVEEQQPPLQALITPKALFLNKVAKAVGSVEERRFCLKVHHRHCAEVEGRPGSVQRQFNLHKLKPRRELCARWAWLPPESASSSTNLKLMEGFSSTRY
ncbi:hypothetical protein HU200_050501 [Digitaria exilis]|uniref:DUF4283 domain-containing protein n=1 Tax=Digitaria exilis TaxID=1010633 RepID=A0A835B2B1_9POAL|nr:hypothetical protein HU200_050501 [Digitaria exilis]